MTNDPYLSKVAAAPPNDADYDAAYAEITATASVPAMERITDIVLALRDLARRVDAMIALAPAADTGAIAATDATSPVPLGPPSPLPRAAPSDSLAALRALSEEELIALFS